MATTRRRLVPGRWTAAACALLVVAGCNGRRQAPAAGPLARDATAVFAVGADINGVHPLLDDTTELNREILGALYLHLFEEQPDFADRPPSFAPQLAAAWQFSDDRLTLDIELRPEARWSDGVPITAADVVWSWQRQVDPRIAWQRSSVKSNITEIEALGDHRLRVRFATASSHQLSDLNEGAVMPRHAWSSLAPDEWRTRSERFRDPLVVSGPYTLAAWEPNRQIELVANDSYFEDGLPRIERVVFRIVPDSGGLVPRLLAGEFDFARKLPPGAAARVVADPQAELLALPARQYTFVWWNLARPLFADAGVRRALTQAIDRQALVDTLWYGYARVGSSPLLSSLWAHDPELAPWSYDPGEARRLLAAAGWRDSDGDGVLDRDGDRFSFELLTNADNRQRVDAAVMIQEQLRRVGVEAEVRSMEFQQTVRRIQERQFDAMLSAWSIDTSLDLRYAFHSASIADGQNFGGYANPEVDRLIDAARDAVEPERRVALLRRVERLLHADQPYTFLWEPLQLHGHRRRLVGVRSNPLSSLFQLERWWLEPAGRG